MLPAGDRSRGGCRRHHRLPKRFFVSMENSVWLLKVWAKLWDCWSIYCTADGQYGASDMQAAC